VRFDVGAGSEIATILYDGILPDLFREGQGIVALGKMNSKNELVASEVLAKHDETYMPPEVADALEKAHEKKKLEEQDGKTEYVKKEISPITQPEGK
jgi:cytochrome c-type biogenesis protein CcmE